MHERNKRKGNDEGSFTHVDYGLSALVHNQAHALAGCCMLKLLQEPEVELLLAQLYGPLLDVRLQQELVCRKHGAATEAPPLEKRRIGVQAPLGAALRRGGAAWGRACAALRQRGGLGGAGALRTPRAMLATSQDVCRRRFRYLPRRWECFSILIPVECGYD
eukprot:6206546-Pleurochrysis_carterae.AAC.9